jgi:hypothetical protein
MSLILVGNTCAAERIDRLTLASMVTPAMTVMASGYRAWIAELVQAPNDDELRFACRIVGKDLLKLSDRDVSTVVVRIQ